MTRLLPAKILYALFFVLGVDVSLHPRRGRSHLRRQRKNLP